MFYVYVYFNPLKSVNDEPVPFYVGKGSGNRYLIHLKDSKQMKDTNKLKVNILKKIKAANLEPIIKKVFESEDENLVKQFEIDLIARYGRRDLNLGPLANLTDGGEGTSGHIVSEDTKMKIRNAFRDPNVKANHSIATSNGMGPKKKQVVRPKKGTVQCNKKISQCTKAAMTDAVRKKISRRTREALKGKSITKTFSTVHCKNLSKSHMKLSDLQISKIFHDKRLHKEIAMDFNISASHVGCIKRLGRPVYRNIILGE